MTSVKTRNAVDYALRLLGYTPQGWDVDAFIGSLLNGGIHVMSEDEVTSAMFDDRCDFMCHICHAEDDE